MWERHRTKIIVIACIVAFIFVKYGIIDKKDVKSIVHDASELTHEFKDFVKDMFSQEEHKAKSDSTKTKEK